jgi:dimeric dUTPase (all-alpha-NTP-PPase superfamily)
MCAYDYCKLKKRSDLAVVLEEFVDTSKSVLDIGFSYVEDFDFKAIAKDFFS